MPICDFALQIERKALTAHHLQRKNLLQKPTSLGVHLRNRRLLAGQTQRQAASQMGVLREVYDRWERDETEPPVGFWKRIIAFFGYYPMPQNSGGTAGLVLMARRVQGLSQYALGRKLGVIAKTVRLWESGSAEPDQVQLRCLDALAAGIATSPASVLRYSRISQPLQKALPLEGTPAHPTEAQVSKESEAPLNEREPKHSG